MIGALLLKILRTFNRFIRLREQVRLSRSAIDITLKRRAALIPEICDVIAEVTNHEKKVLELVTELRNAQAETASHEILALAEAYPVINSSENFLHLQNELGRTEEKIAMARSFLNDSILAMDNLRATLTGIVFSPLFAKEQRPSE
jgi:LemA protein